MAASARAELKAEKMVGFPTLGSPTIPQFNAMIHCRGTAGGGSMGTKIVLTPAFLQAAVSLVSFVPITPPFLIASSRYEAS